MISASSILDFQFEAEAFVAEASRLVSPSTERRIGRANDELRQIAVRHSGIEKLNVDDSEAVYWYFMLMAREGKETLLRQFNTTRLVRRLAWTLTYIPTSKAPTILTSEHFGLAMEVLRSRPKTSVLIAALVALFHSWEWRDQAAELRAFIKSNIRSTTSKRPLLVLVRDNQRLFLQANSPTLLASSWLKKALPLREMPSALEVPRHLMESSFFEHVFASYGHLSMKRSNYREICGELCDALEDETFLLTPRASRHLLAKMIIRLQAEPETHLRNRVQLLAFNNIGDPAHTHSWTDCNETLSRELEKARAIVNAWLAQRFILAFFDKVAMDRDRRDFWVRYAQHVTEFRLFTDYWTELQLKRDSRISKYVPSRVSVVGGTSRYSGQSALMMHLGDKIVVEFSNKGAACYIYADSNNFPSFKKRYDSVAELRDTSVPLLMRYSGYYLYKVRSHGRFIHKGDWQYRLETWIKERLGIKPA